MSVKPILFGTEMVRAILEGRKTVTRRIVKPQPVGKLAYCMAGYKRGTWGYPSDDVWEHWGDAYKRDTPIPENEMFRHWTPPCHTGDVLWVRETWSRLCFGLCTQIYVYRASEEPPFPKIIPIGCHLTDHFKWRPSIHMPKEAARIWLRVTDVRVERLQDCGNAQAKDEGCTCCSQFVRIWDSAIKPADRDLYGWLANPWVWVIEFEKCEKPEES